MRFYYFFILPNIWCYPPISTHGIAPQASKHYWYNVTILEIHGFSARFGGEEGILESFRTTLHVGSLWKKKRSVQQPLQTPHWNPKMQTWTLRKYKCTKQLIGTMSASTGTRGPGIVPTWRTSTIFPHSWADQTHKKLYNPEGICYQKTNQFCKARDSRLSRLWSSNQTFTKSEFWKSESLF